MVGGEGVVDARRPGRRPAAQPAQLRPRRRARRGVAARAHRLAGDLPGGRSRHRLRLDRAGLEQLRSATPTPAGCSSALREQHDREMAQSVAGWVRRLRRAGPVALRRLCGPLAPMAILPIRIYPDPVLRVRCPEVTEFDAELARLAADMVETMHAAPGVGPRRAAGRGRAAAGGGRPLGGQGPRGAPRAGQPASSLEQRGPGGRGRGLPVAARLHRQGRPPAARARWRPRTSPASRFELAAEDCWRAPSATRSTTSTACSSPTACAACAASAPRRQLKRLAAEQARSVHAVRRRGALPRRAGARRCWPRLLLAVLAAACGGGGGGGGGGGPTDAAAGAAAPSSSPPPAAGGQQLRHRCASGRRQHSPSTLVARRCGRPGRPTSTASPSTSPIRQAAAALRRRRPRGRSSPRAGPRPRCRWPRAPTGTLVVGLTRLGPVAGRRRLRRAAHAASSPPSPPAPAPSPSRATPAVDADRRRPDARLGRRHRAGGPLTSSPRPPDVPRARRPRLLQHPGPPARAVRSRSCPGKVAHLHLRPDGLQPRPHRQPAHLPVRGPAAPDPALPRLPGRRR